MINVKHVIKKILIYFKVINVVKKIILYISIFKYKNEPRIFCISMQRTGTTSVGRFFFDFGFRWAGWPISESNQWSVACYNGNYEEIFSSSDFKINNAFEDAPWFYPGFYKVLYHRFPNAKFILFTRDFDSWYQSMINHSGGDVIGRSVIHCKIYRRELEYFDLLRAGEINEENENRIGTKKTMKLINKAEHYEEIYRLHALEVKDFFKRNSPDSLHVGSLDDPLKWKKLGVFLDIKVPDDYNSHENSSLTLADNKKSDL